LIVAFCVDEPEDVDEEEQEVADAAAALACENSEKRVLNLLASSNSDLSSSLLLASNETIRSRVTKMGAGGADRLTLEADETATDGDGDEEDEEDVEDEMEEAADAAREDAVGKFEEDEDF
jgi:hypothetical protein